ncbi:hypothetical protein EWM62_07750 [Mucilaginibacter terrigena]|uniref:PKD domain-containing protein n=1 Tax=Mucilaginibacter terrigena TaxID=2492395 RepID=A0A4V1ZBW1_9SPHI|nr:PKD domain-containing protein [Mucilaginibacter terrigena]RYU90540.1 hypothetical protein EWM62_07750 [Mucilaginibacter terrigena]
MKINIKALITICLAAVIIAIGCKKQEYSFGKIITPKDLTITTEIEGVDDTHPAGSGSGNVTINASATDAISYKVDFGDGSSKIVGEGALVHKYTTPGTTEYTVVVNAVGTGGVTTTTTKTITVFVAFEIPAEILQNLTNGGSQTWVIDRLTPGHVGVGAADTYTSNHYSATPNQRDECLYDDEITFTKDGKTINMTVDNKGQSFFIAAATAFYGKSGGDNCYDLDVTGTKKLVFMDATSGSTPANSTRIQFTVPGNGLIAFGTGGSTYELMELTATTFTVRTMSVDGLAWYQKFKVK